MQKITKELVMSLKNEDVLTVKRKKEIEILENLIRDATVKLNLMKFGFKPGDLVVCLLESKRKSFLKGNIYVVKEIDRGWLYVEIDSNGKTTNGFPLVNFRLATFEDVAMSQL
jgi:hypothetical protein